VPEGTEGIVLTWRIMGSNGLVDWNPGLAIESYTRGAPDDFRKGWGVKTLFRPFPDFRFGIHRPTVKGAGRDADKRAQLSFLRWVNGSGQPMTRQFLEGMWRSSAATLGYDLAEMAHFAVKSREAYLLRQLRGNVNSKPDKYDATYFGIFDRNETEQTGLLRHLPAVKDRVADYLRDPILAGLHQDGLAWHARQIERLRAEDHPSPPDGAARASMRAWPTRGSMRSCSRSRWGPGQIHRRQAAPGRHDARRHRAACGGLGRQAGGRTRRAGFRGTGGAGDRAGALRLSCACRDRNRHRQDRHAILDQGARLIGRGLPWMGASSLSPTCIARASAAKRSPT
jgi:hypothetical protein